MADKNPRKFYVTKSGFGFDEGIYDASELSKLPKGAQQTAVPLSVALSKHLIEADYNSSDNVNELKLFVPTDPNTGKSTKTFLLRKYASTISGS